MERLTIRRDHGIIMADGYDFGIDPDDYDLVQEILARLAAYEDAGLEPEEVTALQTLYRAYTKEMDGMSVQHFLDLVQAEKESRLLILDDETALALAAVVYGCNTNRRLIGATHMWDFRGRCGGPKQITYSRAIQKLNGLAENVLNKGGESE